MDEKIKLLNTINEHKDKIKELERQLYAEIVARDEWYIERNKLQKQLREQGHKLLYAEDLLKRWVNECDRVAGLVTLTKGTLYGDRNGKFREL